MFAKPGTKPPKPVPIRGRGAARGRKPSKEDEQSERERRYLEELGASIFQILKNILGQCALPDDPDLPPPSVSSQARRSTATPRSCSARRITST